MAYLLPLGALHREHIHRFQGNVIPFFFADCGLAQCTIVNANVFISGKPSCTVPMSLGDLTASLLKNWTLVTLLLIMCHGFFWVGFLSIAIAQQKGLLQHQRAGHS